MAEGTPMMQQYHRIKDELPECILFFRLGDFYEMFNEDAVTASRELDLALTTRDRTRPPEEQTPMCGVPYHAYEGYVAKLLAKGYKVAVCEQMEDPALAKGLVKRDVLRIITPGTVIEKSMLEERRANYLCAVLLEEDGGAVCFADISTGEFLAAEFEGPEAVGHISNELIRYAPSEVLLSPLAATSETLRTVTQMQLNCPAGPDEAFGAPDAEALFEQHFGRSSSDSGRLIRAAGAALSYLHRTQKTDLRHIDRLTCYQAGIYMELDWQTRRNLELTETLRSREKKGSLLWVLDSTKTSMGGRTLRGWLEKPLLSPAMIERRLNAVSELTDGTFLRGEIRELLRSVDDMERLIGRIVYGNANARDLAALADSAAVLPQLRGLLAGSKSALLREISEMDPFEELRERIQMTIGDNPPFSVREAGMIRPGFDPEVDSLRALSENARGAVAEIEARERERTGFKKLRIGYNKVFGYYIELPRSASENVPDSYIRKQTLVSSERFITEELKDLESRILTAHDRLQELEYRIFKTLSDEAAAEAPTIRRTAGLVATLDALASLAELAAKNGYCRPVVDLSGVIDIRDGRHPVVERTRTESLFVANDTHMDTADERALIITGPNMAGKSTYMRQTALIVLMAQIGSFVPAKSAHIGLTDRIFTRIGASDDLASGQSTFMVEMTETAAILKQATERSLILLDEIGRGTSTYDGMSIARAVLEYCADRRRLGARTMFATHYHELTELEKELPGVKNLSTAVKKRGEDIIFLRRIVPGGADRSYGVEVARLAGVPEPVIRRAKSVLNALEQGAKPLTAEQAESLPPEPEEQQLSFGSAGAEAALDRLKELDLNTLTPLEAMNLLFELKNLLN